MVLFTDYSDASVFCTGNGAVTCCTMQVFPMHMFIFLYLLSFDVLYPHFCIVVSITFTTNGNSVTGSEFSIAATINISEIVDVLALIIQWLDSSGNEQNATSEVVGSGMSELVPSGPVVSTLDLTFSSLTLSQAGVYTIGILIFDIYGNVVSIQRSYLLIIQSKCSYLLCTSSG